MMMKHLAVCLILTSLAGTAAEVPPMHGETLQYSINWPSGLSLGEGKMSASRNESGQWSFQLLFDASVPGFAVIDKYTSLTSADQCSLSFEKDLQHGSRKTREILTFENGKAIRKTVDGGSSEREVAACARDALAFLFHVRRELAQGRIPSAQEVHYGAAYRVRLEYKGTQKVKVGEALEDADRLIAHVKGPASDLPLEFYIGKDAARTPLMVKVPIALATFSVELVR